MAQEQLMDKIIASTNREVGIKPFRGTRYQAEVTQMALQSYGHLIRSVPMKTWTLREFGAVIAKNYDTANPQTKEVVRVLDETHALNVNPEENLEEQGA